nr:cation:proton antiporter [Micromonospora sp. DSM 115978]
MYALGPVAPLSSHQLSLFLLQLSVLLLLALCLGRLAALVRLPTVVGELLAGLVLGPSLLGALAPPVADWLTPPEPAQLHLLDAVGQLGVLLLVAVTGAHLDVKMLRRRRSAVVWVSLGGLLVPLGLGVAVALALPDRLVPATVERPVFAFFIGIALCVSAIPVIAKILGDLNLLHRDVGQLTIASAMVNDAVAWFLLSIASAMATVGVHLGLIGRSVLYLTGFVLLAVFVLRPATRWLLRQTARTGEPGATVAAVVIIVLVCSWATHALGLEAIFGAFLAGAVIGSPGVADLRLLAPLRLVVLAVLAPLFLATAGLRMDLTALADPTVLVAALAVVLVAVLGKLIGAYLGARLGRLGHWEGLALGAGLNARGVVEVIMAYAGLRLGVLNTASYTVVVLVAVATSLMAPPLLRAAMRRVEISADEKLRKEEHEVWALPAPGSPSAQLPDPTR